MCVCVFAISFQVANIYLFCITIIFVSADLLLHRGQESVVLVLCVYKIVNLCV